ncbi:MAG: hypothetical protein J7K98_02305 [Candidatus Aenigmarchaeota archaeon]|nr:hypothetical protein [Candidatus Aenigmarchaeota archaeon]
MISLVDFLKTISKKVREDLLELGRVIGKEVVDSTAVRKGIVIDMIKYYEGIQASIMGFKYKPEELKKIKRLKGEVLVCLGSEGRFFVPKNKVKAIGNFVLLDMKINLPELRLVERKREEVYRTYNQVRQKLKKFLPEFLSLQTEEQKGWLDRIMGE